MNVLEAGTQCTKKAISHLKAAVALYGRGTDTYTRGLVERNLGIAYCKLGDGEEGKQYFKQAMAYFTRAQYPAEYADTQVAMGNAERMSSSGHRLTRLKNALDHYAEAMVVYEEEVFPIGFAETQHAMAIAHRQLAVYEDKYLHLEIARKCYGNAIRVFTEKSFPQVHCVMATNMAQCLKETKMVDI